MHYLQTLSIRLQFNTVVDAEYKMSDSIEYLDYYVVYIQQGNTMPTYSTFLYYFQYNYYDIDSILTTGFNGYVPWDLEFHGDYLLDNTETEGLIESVRVLGTQVYTDDIVLEEIAKYTTEFATNELTVESREFIADEETYELDTVVNNFISENNVVPEHQELIYANFDGQQGAQALQQGEWYDQQISLTLIPDVALIYSPIEYAPAELEVIAYSNLLVNPRMYSSVVAPTVEISNRVIGWKVQNYMAKGTAYVTADLEINANLTLIGNGYTGDLLPAFELEDVLITDFIEGDEGSIDIPDVIDTVKDPFSDFWDQYKWIIIAIIGVIGVMVFMSINMQFMSFRNSMQIGRLIRTNKGETNGKN